MFSWFWSFSPAFISQWNCMISHYHLAQDWSMISIDRRWVLMNWTSSACLDCTKVNRANCTPGHLERTSSCIIPVVDSTQLEICFIDNRQMNICRCFSSSFSYQNRKFVCIVEIKVNVHRSVRIWTLISHQSHSFSFLSFFLIFPSILTMKVSSEMNYCCRVVFLSPSLSRSYSCSLTHINSVVFKCQQKTTTTMNKKKIKRDRKENDALHTER